MSIIADAEEFRKVLKNFIKNLKSYSNNCQNQINQQPAVSSYKTTKEARILVVSSNDTVVKSLETLRQSITDAIEVYKIKIGQMYSKRFLGIKHTHRQSRRLTKLFKKAYSDLCKAQGVKEGEGSAAGNLTDLTPAQITYRDEVTKIYRGAREYEQTRLNDIQQFLIKFMEAVHSTPHVGGLNQIYQELLAKIQEKQNTTSDLDFWAKIHGIPLVATQVSTRQNSRAPITTAGNDPIHM